MSKLLVYDPAKDKDVLVGEIEDGVLYRSVLPEHFMRVVDGYGIQESAFQELPQHDVKKIVLKTEIGTTYTADMQTWIEHGRVADYGHGKQRFLSLKYMKVGETNE